MGHVRKSWWVLLVIVLAALFYFHSMYQKELAYRELLSRKGALEQERVLALAEHQDLLLQIRSQTDPAWVELVLMKGLGLVPQGQTKVYFTPE